MIDETDKNEASQEEALIETLAEEETDDVEDAADLEAAEDVALEDGGKDEAPLFADGDAPEAPKGPQAPAEAAPESAPIPPNPATPAAAKDKKTCPLDSRAKAYFMLKIIVGTAMIIAGIWVLVEAHVDVDSAAFGADFYTYAYQAIVNVANLLHAIAIALGWLLIGLGAHMDISVLRPRPHHPHMHEPKQD